jgi:uncharacterized protein (TIGR01244 family)
MFRRLDDHVLVAGQLRPEDIAAAKADGVTMIVNNRPDGEQPGQPSGREIEQAARAAGLDYRAIPIGAAGLGRQQIDAMASAMEESDGQVLAYCLSGTRSAFLWALARAERGEQAETLIAKAARAGYDLRPIAAALRAL